MSTGVFSHVDAVVDRLVQRARLRDVPDQVLSDAAKATVRAFRDVRETDVPPHRIEAYFSAVVRRRLVRGRSGSRAVARMLADTVVRDLKQSGRDGAAVWDELDRGWRHTIPGDLLEEYRVRLCA